MTVLTVCLGLVEWLMTVELKPAHYRRLKCLWTMWNRELKLYQFED